MTLLEYCHC